MAQPNKEFVVEHSQLKELSEQSCSKVTHAELSGSVNLSDVKSLMARLPWCHNLVSLDLNCNSLGPEGAAALAPVLGQLKQLQFLLLINNHVGDQGAQALANTLPQLNSLTGLYLDGNDLNPEAISALAPALSELQKLQHLSLGINNLGNQGAQYLAKILPQLKELAYLGLDKDDLGPEAIKALAPALSHLKNLLELNLECNYFGDLGIKYLAYTLTQLPKLNELHIASSAITAGGIDVLLNVLPLTNITLLPEDDETDEYEFKLLKRILMANKACLENCPSILALVLACRRRNRKRELFLPLEIWDIISKQFKALHTGPIGDLAGASSAENAPDDDDDDDDGNGDGFTWSP